MRQSFEDQSGRVVFYEYREKQLCDENEVY